jgi:hypothetical protein
MTSRTSACGQGSFAARILRRTLRISHSELQRPHP